MLFAIRYQPQASRTEEETKRLYALIMAWEPPSRVEVQHHYHYAGGGGVVIIDTEDPTALYETMEPFKPMVKFDVEPVINFIQAMAVSLDVEEWAASVKNGAAK